MTGTVVPMVRGSEREQRGTSGREDAHRVLARLADRTAGERACRTLEMAGDVLATDDAMAMYVDGDGCVRLGPERTVAFVGSGWWTTPSFHPPGGRGTDLLRARDDGPRAVNVLALADLRAVAAEIVRVLPVGTAVVEDEYRSDVVRLLELAGYEVRSWSLRTGVRDEAWTAFAVAAEVRARDAVVIASEHRGAAIPRARWCELVRSTEGKPGRTRGERRGSWLARLAERLALS